MMHLGGWLIFCGVMLLLAAYAFAPPFSIWPDKRLPTYEVIADFRKWVMLVCVLAGAASFITGFLFIIGSALVALLGW